MKKVFIIFLIAFTAANAQFKSEGNKPVDIKSKLVNNNPSSFLLSFINPQNFSMRHSFSLSYSAFGGNGIALGIYTNRLAYKFSDNLNIEVDASVINSPYSTFGKEFSDRINGIYLTRAQLNYKPSEDFQISIQYRNSPFGYYGYPGYSRYPYYNPFYNDFYDEN